ncbi:hypothetical protein D3C75_787890 [compost metagenome]
MPELYEEVITRPQLGTDLLEMAFPDEAARAAPRQGAVVHSHSRLEKHGEQLPPARIRITLFPLVGYCRVPRQYNGHRFMILVDLQRVNPRRLS